MKSLFIYIITSKAFNRYRTSLIYSDWIEIIKITVSMLLPPIVISIYRALRDIFNKKDYKGEYIRNKSFLIHNIKLKDMSAQFDYTSIESQTNYNWDKLEASILKYGVIDPPEVTYSFNDNVSPQYSVIGGNHRIAILRKLYGSDHEITVRLYPEKNKHTL